MSLFHNCPAVPSSGWAERGRLAVILLTLLLSADARSQPVSVSQRWSQATEAALSQAGTNHVQMLQALERVPESQRPALEFLVTNMPPRDLQSLSAEFLLENVSLAYQALEEAPWGKRIPGELFLNDILPYASVTERRDNWRQRLHEICWPLVRDCRTPGEAGQALNQQLFRLLKVRYSMSRRAPDQGPLETMATGVATCTGLSILLVDACRSVGVPARIAGTPLWSNHSGNHTWVEIWDDGWHFTGAAEPDPQGLDRGWFVGNAAQAVKDDRLHAIYASSFQRTGLTFPVNWARRADYVSAVNVTDRYAIKTQPTMSSGMQLAVEVLNRPAGQRVVARITVTDSTDPSRRFEGTSKGDTADMNDLLSFPLARQHAYVVEAEFAGQKARQPITTGTNAWERMTLFLDRTGTGSEPRPAK